MPTDPTPSVPASPGIRAEDHPHRDVLTPAPVPVVEPRTFAIKVIWNDGEEEYLKEGYRGLHPARFTTCEAAEQVEFMKIGMEDECQSINVVPYPRQI